LADFIAVAPDFRYPIVDESGKATEDFQRFAAVAVELLNALNPTIGTGTPESVLSEGPQSIYIDSSAPVGEGIYIKESGTGKTGWVKRS
tara:strand:- start:8582 stop:8848 length:267 start_codon:yes stop_codon:yes gene_type:complete